MNWMKAVIAGAGGGIVVTIYQWLVHGFIMSNTYMKYNTVFSQEPSNPLWFFLVGIVVPS